MAEAITHTHGGYSRNKSSVGITKHDRQYDQEDKYFIIDEDMQKRKYGGFHIGAAFFGWIVGTGIGVIIAGILASVGGAVALSTQSVLKSPHLSNGGISTIGIISAVFFLLTVIVAYFAGGYVAGRLSRFDGVKQGVGVWIISILMTVILGSIGVAIGANLSVLQRINLTHLPVQNGTLTIGGIVMSLLILVISLAAAISGGKVGVHYHSKVNNEGIIDQTV